MISCVASIFLLWKWSILWVIEEGMTFEFCLIKIPIFLHFSIFIVHFSFYSKLFFTNTKILPINFLSANLAKWSSTFKQFVGNLSANCLSVFDHFVKLALKGLKVVCLSKVFKLRIVTIFWLNDRYIAIICVLLLCIKLIRSRLRAQINLRIKILAGVLFHSICCLVW